MSSSKQGFYSKVTMSPNVFRHVMNCWPPFWGTRIHIEEISSDWRYVRTRMKLSMRNKNYVGSHFGGGMFAMTDPFYMVALKNILGDTYLVWDKAATIDYVKPGRTTVYAEFNISDEQLAEIYAKTAEDALHPQTAGPTSEGRGQGGGKWGIKGGLRCGRRLKSQNVRT
jgi:acyl-coenzyme A thioesterase PaaI-like protein